MEGLPSVEADRFNGSAFSGLEKKRKKGPENVDEKYCNCKRSRCMKLYCECFSAGLYCSEFCECDNCVNSRDYEDFVQYVCEKIRSRNPDAFKSKILQPEEITESSTSARPTIARHKSGCNCKRSMCMKKYCECYQAGVACSPECRCEDCKNTFGKKNETGEIPQSEHNDEILNTVPSNGNIEGADLNSNMGEPFQYDSHVLQGSNGSNHLVQQSQVPLEYYASLASNASLNPSYFGSTSYLESFQGSDQAPIGPFYGNNSTTTIVQHFIEGNPAVKPNSGGGGHHRYNNDNP